ncbi:MAG: hypothetical protein A2X22_11035 [Bacteroidetes bacterium GWF2_49_14]|nr:MAG: hypothetical protein A2X22_11035 [Bacteroidetes bacterium GWF2_49_14]
MTSQCPIMRGVPADELLHLFENLQFQIKSYRKDEIMAIQGDEVKRLMILLEGSARGEMTDSEGRAVKIEDVAAPRPLAGAFLFGQENRYPVDVLANESVKVLIIYREEFLKLLGLNQTVMMNYLSLVSSKAQFLSRKIKFLTFKTIREKLANYLVSIGVRQNEVKEISASQKDLADLFGVARPSVARGLAELEKEGVIEIRNRRVKVLDMKALLALKS